MIPYFFRHYNEIVDKFFIWDNGSNDGSLDLLKGDERVLVMHWEVSGDSFVEAARMLTDHFWKPSRGNADWVFVVDLDEHLFHPDMRAHLQDCTRAGATAVKVVGYDMMAEQFPTEDKPLWELVTRGVRYSELDKMAVFDPNAIVATNHRVGRHSSAPTGRVIWNHEPVLLLHYKRLGAEYVAERNALLRTGLRPRDFSQDYGFHYELSGDDVEGQHRMLLRTAMPVPGLPGFESPTAAACSPEQELALLRDSGLFDEASYLGRYPDIRRAGHDALEHFCQHGWREGRSPNRYFDSRWYADAYGELIGDANPLLDYFLVGEALGRRPSPGFDPADYRFRHGLPTTESPLLHALRAEAAQVRSRRLPDDFDPARYLEANPDVAAAGVDPAWHFLHFGSAEGRRLRLPESGHSG